MGNWVLSLLVLGASCGFLLLISIFIILQLTKEYKLVKQNKIYDGIRSRNKSKPIYIQRTTDDAVYDFNSVQEWQDMGILSSTERSTDREEFKTHSKADS